MLDLGIPPKLVRLTKKTMNSSPCAVRIQGDLGAEFAFDRGLKQGDGLAPMLFNLALEGVVRETEVDVNGELCYRSKQLTAYADDIDCLARSFLELHKTFRRLEEAAGRIGLQVNEDKTKMMIMSRRGGGPRHRANFGSYTFENVEEFKYLSSIITSDNNEAREVQARIKVANREYFSLLPIMKSRDVRRDTKILLYKTLIRSGYVWMRSLMVDHAEECKRFGCIRKESPEKNLRPDTERWHVENQI
ncbi:uncharacterized protein [Temnothorax nylanderi]|uniref:uncharacterized protein isoform X1 n=1 Tax=Temnothorax nylanderi TaxID=102681 RepID=UPI003A86F2A5